MSEFNLRKATRQQAKLRLALIGPAGAGKTYSALDIGTNLVPGGRVALIDTECGSAELYGDKFSFDTIDLANHSPLKYVEAIRYLESEGYDVIIVDSLSHAWMGKDGALEQVDKAADRDPRANSFTAWRSVTPKHNALVEAMLSCKAHLIATIRAKTEFIQEKNAAGKTEIRKIGLAPIQRDGLEYEFTMVGDIDLSNTLKISKTRLDGVIAPGDIFEKPGAGLAKKIHGWLMSGSPAAPKPAPVTPRDPPPPVESTSSTADDLRPSDVHLPASPLADAADKAFAEFIDNMASATTVPALDAAATGPGKPAKGTPQHKLATDIYLRQKSSIERLAKANGASAAVNGVAS